MSRLTTTYKIVFVPVILDNDDNVVETGDFYGHETEAIRESYKMLTARIELAEYKKFYSARIEKRIVPIYK